MFKQLFARVSPQSHTSGERQKFLEMQSRENLKHFKDSPVSLELYKGDTLIAYAIPISSEVNDIYDTAEEQQYVHDTSLFGQCEMVSSLTGEPLESLLSECGCQDIEEPKKYRERTTKLELYRLVDTHTLVTSLRTGDIKVVSEHSERLYLCTDFKLRKPDVKVALNKKGVYDIVENDPLTKIFYAELKTRL